jgi:hypothetical protein
VAKCGKILLYIVEERKAFGRGCCRRFDSGDPGPAATCWVSLPGGSTPSGRRQPHNLFFPLGASLIYIIKGILFKDSGIIYIKFLKVKKTWTTLLNSRSARL